MHHATQPFRGQEMVADGNITRHRLRHHYVQVLPGVHLHKDVELTAFRKARAVWVWSRGRVTLAGLSAAAVWGAKWIDPHEHAACNHPRRMHTWTWVDI